MPTITSGRRAPAALSPASYEAYDLYLKGRYFWNKRTAQGFQQAVQCFEQAIAKDPKYARAYAGLADTYALMSTYYLAPPNEVMPKARTAALKALQIDDGLAEAHTSLALIAEIYDWDWQTGEKEYRRAIQLNPNYATAHHWYAEFLAFQGRFDEALAESERARHLDPLSVIIAADRGAILYFARQYDRAIEQFRAVLDMEPNFSRAHVIVGAYVEKGRFADALAHIETWRRIEDSPWVWATEVCVYSRSGQPVEGTTSAGEIGTVEPPEPFGFRPSFRGGVHLHEQQRRSACQVTKSLRGTFHCSRRLEGGSGLRPAAQRSPLPGFTPPRWVGPVKEQPPASHFMARTFQNYIFASGKMSLRG